MSVLDFISDAALAGRFFEGSTWAAWRVALAAIFGLPIGADELELFRVCTGRERPPESAVREAWFVVGGRGGKSMIAAAVAVFLAVIYGVLRRGADFGPGELGIAMVLASDRQQARQIVWPRILQAADIGHRRPKDLRDTFASQLLSAGVQLGYVSTQLGHADFGVTVRHYAKWVGGDEYRAALTLEPGEVPADLLARLVESPQAPLIARRDRTLRTRSRNRARSRRLRQCGQLL